MSVLLLEDGTKLESTAKPDTYILGDDTVILEQNGDQVTVRRRSDSVVLRRSVTLMDRSQRPKRQKQAAAKSATGDPGQTAVRRPGKPVKPGRWATLNRFIDDVAPFLGSHEVAVWAMLFRRANPAGIVKTSVRQLAGPGRSFSTVARAIARLERAGLLEYLSKAKHKGEPSIVRLTTKPEPPAEPLHG